MIKAVRLLALFGVILLITACETTKVVEVKPKQVIKPVAERFSSHEQRTYPSYVSLVKLPNLNTTSKVINIRPRPALKAEAKSRAKVKSKAAKKVTQ